MKFFRLNRRWRYALHFIRRSSLA